MHSTHEARKVIIKNNRDLHASNQCMYDLVEQNYYCAEKNHIRHEDSNLYYHLSREAYTLA